METNEKLKIALLQETEKEVLTMIEHFETIPEGDLQMLEQSVLSACLALGRTMLEQILPHSGEEAERPSRRQGECGHQHRLVGLRPKQIPTLMGKVTIGRAYYQCFVEEKEPRASCSHGQAPWDSLWGLIAGRTSPGVQKQLGKLVSRLTLAEAVDTFTSLLPLPMSERQALNLIQPIGDALREQEEKQVASLFSQAANKETHTSERSAVLGPSIRRLYSETDGVMARIRRGSVSMEEVEVKRKGDIYREIKVGAVFEGILVGSIRTWCLASFSTSRDPLRMWPNDCLWKSLVASSMRWPNGVEWTEHGKS